MGTPLPFNSLGQLRAALYAEYPHLARLDEQAPADVAGIRRLAKTGVKTRSAHLGSPVADFYLTNPIARASAVMAECSQLALGFKQAAE